MNACGSPTEHSKKWYCFFMEIEGAASELVFLFLSVSLVEGFFPSSDLSKRGKSHSWR